MINKNLTHHRLLTVHPSFDQRTIALFAPQPNQAVKTFSTTLCQQLKRQYDITFSIDMFYVADQERFEEHIKNQAYQLIITLGSECTMRARSMTKAHQSPTPIIFSSVDSQSMPSQTNQMTGVVCASEEYAPQLSNALHYIPHLERVLILADTYDDQMMAIADSFSNEVNKQGCGAVLKSYPIDLNRQEMLNLAPYDMVVVLKQHPSKHDVLRLSNLCKEHKTVLYVSDTTSVRHGAALGFGRDEASMAREVAHLSYQIFTQSFVPEVTVIAHRLKINLRAINEQGQELIKLAPLLGMVNSTHVVEPKTQDRVNAYLRLEQIPLE